jgi:hypothetical protein
MLGEEYKFETSQLIHQKQGHEIVKIIIRKQT